MIIKYFMITEASMIKIADGRNGKFVVVHRTRNVFHTIHTYSI